MDTTLYIALRFSSLALTWLIAFLFLQIRENRKNKIVLKWLKKILETNLELHDTMNHMVMELSDRVDELEENSEVHEEIIQNIISCVIDLWKVNWFLPYKDFDEEWIEESEEKNDKNNGKIMEEWLEILIRKHNNKAGSKEVIVKKPAKKSKKKESKSE